MPSGKIDITLRPLKLAFLVNPKDKKTILEILQLNSYLWGGVFNPVIPIYSKRPRYWESHLKFNMHDVIEGYFDAYDPDFVVCSNKDQKKIKIKNRNIIQLDDILPNVQENYVPSYGVSFFNLLNKYYEEEGRFLQKYPQKIIIPEIKSNNKIFLSAIFGSLSEDIDAILKKNFDKPLEITRPSFLFNEYIKYFDSSNLYPYRIVRYGIKHKNINRSGESNFLFFMDSTSIIDIIDYWNLRASGCNVVPIAKQLSSSPELINFCQNFIENNFFKHKHYEHVYSKVSVVKSRTVSQSDAEDFCKTLLTDATKDKFFLQLWYPRVWDSWGRKSDKVLCCNLEVKAASIEISNQKNASFSTLVPDFLPRNHYDGTPQFVNEIRLNINGDGGEIFGDVIPDGGMELVRSFGIYDDKWRCGNGVLVHLADSLTSFSHITFPEAHIIFSHWLRSQGYNSRLSPAGLLAKSIFKQIGGYWNINLLANKKILNMLDDLSGGKAHLYRLVGAIQKELQPLSKTMLKKYELFSLIENKIWILQESENYGINRDVLIGRLTKILKEDEKHFSAEIYLENFINANILRLGKEIECSNCQRRSWYLVNTLNYELKCPKCMENFKLPQASCDNIKWSYTSVGSLRQPNYAGGAYAVLLSMRFFSRILDANITPFLSFNADCGGKNVEADLAIFYQNKFDYSKPSLIFIECKSFNSFEEIDMKRMQMLVNLFPGAVIVFASLKDELNNKEKNLIKKFVNFNRKRWIRGAEETPVILLNATELFCSTSFLSMAWDKKEGAHKKLSKMHNFSDLNALSDYTLEIYLGMQSAMRYRMTHIKKGPQAAIDQV